MMSLSHLIYPSKGGQEEGLFEPEQQPGSMSMENLKNNYFPSFSTLNKNLKNYIPDFGTIKSLFIEKYNEATWKNVHRFLLNSCYSFNRYEFFIALQCILLVYFPGMALGIVYQYYELDQQTQQLLQEQEREEDIYEILLREMQQPQQPQQQSRMYYIKQQLEEQNQAQLQSYDQHSQSTIMQFVQLIQRFIDQMIQTPQSMLYQIQYQQDCQYINQQIQQMQQHNNNSQCYYNYFQQFTNQNQLQCYQYYQNQCRSPGEEEMQGQYSQYNKQEMNMVQMIIGYNDQIVIIQKQLQVSRATTNSTLNNENGGVNNVIIMVIKIKLPGEGRQIVQF